MDWYWRGKGSPRSDERSMQNACCIKKNSEAGHCEEARKGVNQSQGQVHVYAERMLDQEEQRVGTLRRPIVAPAKARDMYMSIRNACWIKKNSGSEHCKDL